MSRVNRNEPRKTAVGQRAEAKPLPTGGAALAPPVMRSSKAAQMPSRTAEPGKRVQHRVDNGSTQATRDRDDFHAAKSKPKHKHHHHPHGPIAHASGNGSPIDGSTVVSKPSLATGVSSTSGGAAINTTTTTTTTVNRTTTTVG